MEQIVAKLREMEKLHGQGLTIPQAAPKREASKAVNRFVRATGYKLVTRNWYL